MRGRRIMVKNEETVRGIILASFLQGEYGRRLLILTDAYGKITVFAKSAAKKDSKIIGAIRPMTAAEFTISKGRDAYSMHSVHVMDSFDEISTDADIMFYGSYVLEVLDYFSVEGMAPEDAKAMLNLAFLTLSALRKKKIAPVHIRRIFELKMLTLEGLYEEKPFIEDEACVKEWQRVIASPLSKLYTDAAPTGEFCDSVQHLLNMQVQVKFRTLELL
ncbi:MAG: DNA repair protein RecO [Eubacteriales bacterium]|nr:DNA repair protein RecO [Eubacteriales bacterium]